MIHIFHHFDADGYAAAGIIAAMYCKLKYNDNRPLAPVEVFKHNPTDLYFTEEIKFYSCRHNYPMDLSLIHEDDYVYIVDYSFSREDDQEALEALLIKYPNLKFAWIDHHKTSNVIISTRPIFKERLEKDGYVVIPETHPDGSIHLNYSGAMLAYFYVVNFLWYVERFTKEQRIDGKLWGTDNFRDHDEEYLEYLYSRAPEWIRLVSDHDTWRHEIDRSSEFIKGVTDNGLKNVFISTDRNSFLYLFYLTIVSPLRTNKTAALTRRDMYNMIQKNHITRFKEAGEMIFKIEDSKNERFLKSNGFEARFHIDVPSEYLDPEDKMKFVKDERGHVVRDALVLCFNNFGNSRSFGDNLEKYDAVVIFSFNGDNFSYSMFSKPDGFQCNIAALYFGKYYGITGGGHDHAAGWSSPDLTFKKNREYIATAERFDGVVKEEGWPELWKQKSDSEEPKKTS